MSETTAHKCPPKPPASLKGAVVRPPKGDRAVEVARELLARRAAKAEPRDLERYLNEAPDVPPVPGDELPPD